MCAPVRGFGISAALLVLGMLPNAQASASAPGRPRLVAPGGIDGDVRQSDCPTFSWAPVPGAELHELALYRIDDEDRVETEPTLRFELPGSASSWTPAVDQCLERGARYAWALRARQFGVWRDWSEPATFEVASGRDASELEDAIAEVLDRYIEEGRLEGRLEERQIAPADLPPPIVFPTASTPGAFGARRAPAPAVAGGGFKVTATGDVTASSFTGNGAALVGGNLNSGSMTVSSTSYVTLLSRTITVPNSGNLLIVGTVEMQCSSSVTEGDTVGIVTFDVNETDGWPNVDYALGVADCLDSMERFRSVTMTHVIPVTAGTHTVRLLGRKFAGSLNPSFGDMALSVLYID